MAGLKTDGDDDVLELISSGAIEEYVDNRLFAGKIDSLDAHVERKQALADPVRYSILYLLFEFQSISRKRLVEATGRTSNGIDYHLRDLLDANLIAQIPSPEGADGRRTFYRITTLGKHEVKADLENIIDPKAAGIRFGSLFDPDTAPDLEAEGEGPVIRVEGDSADQLNMHRRGLRDQALSFGQAMESG